MLWSFIQLVHLIQETCIRSWTPPGARRGRNGGQDAGGGGPRRVARVRQDVGRPESPAASPGGAYKAREVPGRAPRTCPKGPKRSPTGLYHFSAKRLVLQNTGCVSSGACSLLKRRESIRPESGARNPHPSGGLVWPSRPLSPVVSSPLFLRTLARERETGRQGTPVARNAPP